MKNPPARRRLAGLLSSSRTGAMPAWKRAIDICFCISLLPILALAALVMTIIHWSVSPGPLFFRQKRVGFRGDRFEIFKFRTMKPGANTKVHQHHFAKLVGSNSPMVKLDAQRDSRLVPGGWFLRASGFDELPQIINVLIGDMSLVGPRPCILSEYEQYSRAQRDRFGAVPGLTGLWQVSGKNRTSFEEMIRLDLQYARKLSLFMDLQIILRTPRALLDQIQDIVRERQPSHRSSGESVSQGTLQNISLTTRAGFIVGWRDKPRVSGKEGVGPA